MTFSLAPPWSGPLRAPMAPVMAEWMSASVAAMTRAAKVEALSSWSAGRIKGRPRARGLRGGGGGGGGVFAVEHAKIAGAVGGGGAGGGGVESRGPRAVEAALFLHAD